MEEKDIFKNVDYSKVDIVDLIKTIANYYGTNFEQTPAMNTLQNIIPKKKRTLLILVDGMGYDKVKRLAENSILRKHLKCSLQTVVPTSTACILTSIYTASYPIEHGILGWWSYNRPYELNYFSLLLLDRLTEKKLTSEKVDIKKIYNKKSVFDNLDCTVNILMDREYIHSEYSKLFAGSKAHREGMMDINHGFNVAAKLLAQTESNLTYMYLDGLDLMSHDSGVDSLAVQNTVNEIEKGIQYLIAKNIEDLNIVIFADHGQIDMSNMIYLNKNHDYTKYFYAMPSIDTRMTQFFIKKEYLQEFETNFRNEFEKDIDLLPTEELVRQKVFGPGEISQNIKDALGEYTAIVKENQFLVCDSKVYEAYRSHVGNHSGMTKEELTVPLIVI